MFFVLKKNFCIIIFLKGMITIAKNKVDITGINTSELTVLTEDEKIKLFNDLKNKNDNYARDKLINGNLRLVLSILKNYQNKCDNMDDLFQIGVIGLIKAIDNFDMSYNVKFSTYAVPLILGEVKRYLRDNNNIRISRSIKDLAYKIIKLKEEYYAIKGIEMPNSLIAKELGVDEIEIITALDSLKDPISIQEPIYNDGGDTIYLEDQLENKKDNYLLWDNNISLYDAINDLDKKEKKIIIERFLLGKTQMEIAEEIGISQAQVSRLEKGGIKQIKKKVN